MNQAENSAWIPLGNAHVIDWKHLGRQPSPRGATAWITRLDAEPVAMRAWGEETTSYFEFVFLSDERLAGRVVVAAMRSEAGRLRISISFEVDGLISFADQLDYKEHGRTLLLAHAGRSFELKQGGLREEQVPPLSPSAAEIFELSPDAALLTACAQWMETLLRAARDHVRGVRLVAPAARAAVEAPAPSSSRAAPTDLPPVSRSTPDTSRPDGVSGSRQAPAASALPAPAEPRARTEHGAGLRPNAGRETMDAPAPPRRAPAPSTTPAPAEPPPPRKTGGKKLSVSTNSGESFEIAEDETYIGRSKQCSVILKSQRVSRKHACVTREADGFYINDLGAANGIWKGGEKIDREKIEDGDEFIVGDVVLTFGLG